MIIVFVGVWVVDGRKNISRPLLAAYVLFILMETVIGRKTGVVQVELIPFWSYSHPEHWVEIILNYVLFIPFGLLLSLVKKRDEVGKDGEKEKSGVKLSTGRIVLIGLLFSAAIETTQLLFKIGVFEFDDMIGNTVGCFIGAVVGKMVKKKKKNTPEAV